MGDPLISQHVTKFRPFCGHFVWKKAFKHIHLKIDAAHNGQHCGLKRATGALALAKTLF